MPKNDIIEISDNVSEVIAGCKPVARVFRGAAGQFYWISLETDDMPVGPFEKQDSAEIDADIHHDRRWNDLMMQMIDG